METTTTKKIDLTTSIRELPFPQNKTRIIVCLHQNDVNTLGDLIQKSREDLLSYHNFGKKCVNIVEETLEHFGLSLRNENAIKYVDRLALTPQQWEQRFYEVAKAILAKFIGTSELCDMDNAKEEEIDKAISYAYCFIQTLKDKSELYIEGGDWK